MWYLLLYAIILRAADQNVLEQIWDTPQLATTSTSYSKSLSEEKDKQVMIRYVPF